MSFEALSSTFQLLIREKLKRIPILHIKEFDSVIAALQAIKEGNSYSFKDKDPIDDRLQEIKGIMDDPAWMLVSDEDFPALQALIKKEINDFITYLSKLDQEERRLYSLEQGEEQARFLANQAFIKEKRNSTPRIGNNTNINTWLKERLREIETLSQPQQDQVNESEKEKNRLALRRAQVFYQLVAQGDYQPTTLDEITEFNP